MIRRARQWLMRHLWLPSAALALALVLALRWAGGLQFFELATYDRFIQSLPERGSPYVTIVGFREAGLAQFGYPVSDRALARLLEAIHTQGPRVIGLDLYRNQPEPPGHKRLLQAFRTIPELVGIKKVSSSPRSSSVGGPPVLRLGRVAAAELRRDPDGTIRRIPYNYQGFPSLSWYLARQYLQQAGMELPPAPSAEGEPTRVGGAIVQKLHAYSGGYIGIEPAGYEAMARYQGAPGALDRVSAQQVLNGEVDPELLRDRVVLIGTTAASVGSGWGSGGPDTFPTPYPDSAYGVEIHAHATGQLLAAALDGQPLVRSLPEWCEVAAIGIFCLLAAFLSRGWQGHQAQWNAARSIGANVLLAGGAVLGSYLAFRSGWWLPVVPVGIGILLSFGTARFLNLKQEVIWHAQQLYEQRQQAGLLLMAQGTAHQVQNTVGAIEQAAELIEIDAQSLQQELLQPEPDRVQQLLSDITESALDARHETEQAIQMARQILSLNEPAGQAKQATALNQLVEEIVERFQTGLRKQGSELQLHLDLSEAVGEIAIAPNEIRQVLLELLTNAWKACTAKQQNAGSDYSPAIAAETRANGNHVRIAVRDNGPGLSAQMREHAFDPLVSSFPESTGIGLADVHRIVRAHQGKLDLSSDATGTVVWIELPKNGSAQY